jgi:nicotinate phosphoribosyltransferase
MTAVSAPPGIRERTLADGLRAHPASLFQFVPRMADGWYTDRYFVRTARTLAHAGRDPIVTMQVFAKHDGVLAGVYEVVRMLQTQLGTSPLSGRRYDIGELTIETLLEGDTVKPWEPVLRITGPYLSFAHLETTYLGVLARRTLVASNVRRVLDAAAGKPVLYMGARHDDWRVQTPDGYAARVGGAGEVSSDAGGAWWGVRGVGTMPHSMIASFGGDTVAATIAFARYVMAKEPEVKVASLVDYDNDAVATTLAVARAMRDTFGPGHLWAVRIDTSEKLVDKALADRAARNPDEKLNGVVPPLVEAVRTALDAEGFREVGIGVSGGFTPVKIARFESLGVPVAFYGVGSSLLGHNNGAADGLVTSFDFTADIVRVDGQEESKVGRGDRVNPNLVRVSPEMLAEEHYPPGRM